MKVCRVAQSVSCSVPLTSSQPPSPHSTHLLAALFSTRLILMLSALVRGISPSRGSECMNIKSSWKNCSKFAWNIISECMIQIYPFMFMQTWKSKEHGGMASVVCSSTVYLYLLDGACGHFLDKPWSTVNTPPGQIGLNQNNCSMLLIILESRVWSGGTNYCPKHCQSWRGWLGQFLSFNFIWFALQLIILHHTQLKYQFCNLFLNLFVFIRLLKT